MERDVIEDLLQHLKAECEHWRRDIALLESGVIRTLHGGRDTTEDTLNDYARRLSEAETLISKCESGGS